MVRSKPTPRLPLKPIGYAALMLAVGVTLLLLNRMVKLSPEPASDAAARPPTTAPASGAEKDDSPRQPEDAATENLSGLLLLFSMAAFLVCAICIGWLVVEIRKARPAWKTQKKYPKMR